MTRWLFTIGYEGRDLAAVLEGLEANGVECVLDVRESPFSRKVGFSKRPLTEALEARGIRYVHLKELGTPRALREAVKSSGDYQAFGQKMRKYLASQREAVEAARGFVQRLTCCLLCYERSVAMCHRGIVASAIRDCMEEALDVVHL